MNSPLELPMNEYGVTLAALSRPLSIRTLDRGLGECRETDTPFSLRPTPPSDAVFSLGRPQ